MLDAKTIAVVKSTIPALTGAGTALTAHFYDRMFENNPELKELFNMSNQRNGDQREALFNAICAWATHLETPEALLGAVEKIAQKHTSFNIQPAQYAIVGHHLLETIREMLNPPQAVLDAWGKAYGALADIFIHREAEIYQANVGKSGGWQGTRPFRLVEKTRQSDVITSFEFAAIDDSAVADYQAGQYLAVWLKPEGFPHQEIRQYSLTRKADGRRYRIAVKRETHGQVSGWLHDSAKPGDIVHLAAPAGDFWLDVEPQTPVTLISAGVGQTPMLAMLDTLAHRQHQATVNWFHAAENGRCHAFAREVDTLGARLPRFTRHVWYRQPDDTDQAAREYDSEGLMDLTRQHALINDPAMTYWLCGPIAFMQSVARQLVGLGVPAAHIHYECFGPHKVL